MASARLVFTTILLMLVPAIRSYAIKSGSSSLYVGAPDVNTVVFELYTKSNPTVPEILELGNLEALQASRFNPSLPTKFYAHGWTSGPGSSFSSRDGYFQRGDDLNFIAIDWSVLASGIEYPLIVARDVPRAANHTGAFIDFLVENTGAPLSSFHLIGHSLGAHVVGGAGAAVTTGRIARITGLDPAGPFFSLNDTESRLDISDAEFVDIIHTDGGTLTGNELGFFPPIGHVDFYPNGGQSQPGCRGLPVQTAVQGRNDCDHGRSVSYFAESITSEAGFRAVECETYEDFLAGLCDNNLVMYMGDPTPTTAQGIFYLATSDKAPFALG